MKAYIATVHYPIMEFEAESEDAAMEMAIQAVLTNWDIRKHITIEEDKA